MDKSTPQNSTVKSAYRVLSILETIAHSPKGLTFTDLSVKLGIPKSSLHQLLSTLVETKMITFDHESKTYTLGIKIWELAMTYNNNLSIQQVAWPFLEKLRDQYDETVQMAILDRADVVYVAKISSSHPVQLASQVGSRLPAYGTGLGKAILACLTEQQILNIYPNENFESFTAQTICTRDKLLSELEMIKKRGYARDLGEFSPEIRCVAAPVLGSENRPIAAISISVLGEQDWETKEKCLIPGLLQCAEDLSRRFGATNPSVWRIEKEVIS